MKKVVFGILAAALVSSGCSRKEYLYLADMQDEAGYVVANRHQTRIQDCKYSLKSGPVAH